MKKKKVLIIQICIFAILVVILTVFNFKAYLMKADLFYCQGLALEFLPYRSDKIDLERIEKKDLRQYGSEYQSSEVIWIGFKMPREKYCNDANETLFKLWTRLEEYLNNHRNNELNNKPIKLYITYLSEVTGICNYDTRNAAYLGDKWALYDGSFNNWEEMTLFSKVYGIDNCYVIDITDIDSINPNDWENLKYLHVKSNHEQNVKNYVKEKLVSMFPETDIIIE